MVIIKKNIFRNEQDISVNSSKDDIKFQCIDWSCSDYWEKIDNSDNPDDSEEEYTKTKRLFEIRAYGITEDKCSIFVKIIGHRPYLYVKVPDGWCKSHLIRFKDQLKNKVYNSLKDSVYQCKLIKRKELYGFNNEKKFKFIEIICENIGCFYSVRNVLEGKWPSREKTIEDYGKCRMRLFKIGGEVFDFSDSIYESNIPPLLRFFHDCDGNPAGWLKIKAKKYELIMDTETRCQIEIKCKSKYVKPYDKKDISPIVIASFDIECTSLDGSFPKPERRYDEIIQIGTTVHKYGEQSCCYKSMVTLKKCNKIDGVDLVCCDNERKLLLEWAKIIKKIDPDVITGYNIWGFDMIYIYKRCVNGCGGVYGDFEKIFNEIYSRNNKHKVKFLEKKLTSSALGENFLKYHNCEGIVGIDMFKLIQKDYNLPSYKLNSVSQKFISGDVTKMIINKNSLEITSNNTDGLTSGQHISLNIESKHTNKPNVKKKYKISKIDGQVFTIENISAKTLFIDDKDGKEMYTKFTNLELKVGWYQNKMDLSPQELFANYRTGTPSKMKEIAVYCIKDCELVNFLIIKLAVISNNIGAANVCCVPFSYLFLRGQGIKIFSCFAKECRKEKMMIKVLNRDKINKDGYEGAIVFTPKPDIYFEPVVVMDYASLYPSSMIAENISHETLVVVKEYNIEGKLLHCKGDDKYLNLPNYNYNEISYDAYKGIGDDKVKVGKKVCIFAEKVDGTKGLVPRVLVKFLKARKDTRSTIKYKTIKTVDNKEFIGLVKNKGEIYYINKVDEEVFKINKSNVESIKDTYNDFEKAVLDGLQQAYKVVCNSVYGQVGAPTSQICCKELAASTTAVGRDMVIKARDYTLEKYKGSRLIYGDTDSIFVSFKDYLYEKYGKMDDKELLQKSIEVGMEAGKYVTTKLKKPQDLEYEKTFYPLAIFSKKRYFGNKYEYTNTKYKQTSMGIVLKRRDNAPVVKDIYSGVIDIILNSKDISAATKYYKERVAELLDGNVDIDDLIVTKSVKATQSYSNPTQIAHKVLADRIGMRDPGNCPRANDRVPYCYIDKKELKCKVCNKEVNEKDCKCLKCMNLYCKHHLHNHRNSCVTICRYYKTTIEQDDSLGKCNICSGWYNSTAMVRHRIRKDKYGVEHHDKCKKKLPTKLLQGDIIEHPSYIIDNNIKIDYRYYLDHQIQKPVMQIFDLVMTDASSITKAIIRKNDNKKMGLQNISKWFKVMVKTEECDEDSNEEACF
tara:strand:- start:4570 stop:8292 length:3723 start_codon:yes stop_codon:yes gene_type:complete